MLEVVQGSPKRLQYDGGLLGRELAAEGELVVVDPNSARISGSSGRARATRTCSRAVPDAIWHFHDSQAAHDGISHGAHPPRLSKSATSSRNRHVAAVRCPASSQIRASRHSNGIGSVFNA